MTAALPNRTCDLFHTTLPDRSLNITALQHTLMGANYGN
jgi:hypothetical protein